MIIVAVRGAVSLEKNSDEESGMIEAVGKLLKALEQKNNFSPDDIVSVQMTQTGDLRVKNAAAALRDAIPAYGNVPLFCSQEPEITGALPRTVRVLITWRGEGKVFPVYLGNAASLRPDLSAGE